MDRPARHRPALVRRPFGKLACQPILSLLLATSLSLLGCDRSAPAVDPSRPNILLLTVDTLRADHTSLYAYERDTTPRLAAFFETGRVFERAYSTEANTSPSVISILSGLYPQEHGVRLIYQKAEDSLLLLPDYLRDAGYRTAGVVSNVVLTDEAIGIAARFDHFDDFVDEREEGWNVYERVARRTTNAALAWLEKQSADGAGPIFLWVHYIDPHGPYQPPEEKPVDYTHDTPVPIDPRRVNSGHLRYGVRDGLEYIDRYDEEIAYTDQEMGRLLDAFDRLGFGAHAITVFTADHGETMMEFGQWFTHGYHVWEPIIHVPLAIKATGLDAARIATPVSLIGVTPTILELAGIDLPEALVEATLAGDITPRPTYSEATAAKGRQWRTLIRGDEKWLAHVRADGEVIQRWRYEVEREGEPPVPWSEKDPVGRLLLDRIAADPDPAGVPKFLEKGIAIQSPKVAPGLDEETLERLRALGYVE